MLRLVECEGAPRDLGQDQGRALAPEIRLGLGRAARGRLSRGLAALRPTRGAARDLERYFPHLAERAAGMAEAAGVERVALLERCVAPAWNQLPATRAGVGVGVGTRAAPRGAGPGLAASLPLPADGAAVLRRSRPLGGMASLELGLAWWVGAFAGVNAGGLAALALPAEPAAPFPAGGAGSPAACRAPAALLVTQCLERFERVGAALEWCLRRPAAGPAAILLADAAGEVAGVAIQAAGRQLLRDEDGLLVLGAPEARRARVEKEARLPAMLALDPVGALLASTTPPGVAGEVGLVLLPGERRLGLAGAGSEGDGADWHGV